MQSNSIDYFLLEEALKNTAVLILFFSFLVFSKKKFGFSNNTLLAFFASTCFPFLLYGYLFDINYMNDLKVYKDNIVALREFNFSAIKPSNIKNYSFVFLYSAVPIPFLDSIIRIGFASKLIYLVFMIYLISSKYIKDNSFALLVLIFWPSMILYSSLGLREITIFILIFFTLKSLIEKKLIIWVFTIIILALIKPQNAGILLIISTIYVSIFYFKNLFHFFIILILLATYWFEESINLFTYMMKTINNYRMVLYEEDGNLENYYELIYNFELLLIFITGAFNFILTPLVWAANNSFQLIQSLENLIIITLLLFEGYKSYKTNKWITIFIFFSLFFFAGAYGLVSSNLGTIARWRFPMIGATLLLLYCLNNKSIKFK